MYEVDNGYIIQNMTMPNFAHTHIEHFNACKYLIDLSLTKRVPNDTNSYFLTSLKRINDDEKYLSRIESLLSKERKQKYYRPNRK